MRNSFLAAILFGFFSAPWVQAQSTPYFDQALTEFRNRNYTAASQLFARAEAASPGTTDALLYEAKCLVNTEDFSGAENSLRSYIATHPQSSDALYLLGFVMHRENHPAASLEIYTKAAAITRPLGDDLKIVGLNYILLDDYPDAIKWLEKAVELDSKNKDAWYYLGRAYYTRSRVKDAQRAFSTVLQLDAHDPRAENNLGLIFQSSGQMNDAINAFRNAIAWQEQNPRPSEQPYVNLGVLLMEQGNIDDAIDPLRKAIALAPKNEYCHLKFGIALSQKGETAEATHELEAATQLDPDDPVSHYQLGKLYKQMHEMDRARKEFDRTAELEDKAARSKSAAPNQ